MAYKKAIAKFTQWETGRNWVSGECEGHTFEAKLFDEDSDFGIKDGRVSKLAINCPDGQLVVHYERGWDIKCKRGHARQYNAIMKLCEEAPKDRF